jgi:hypothetical protein
VQGNKNLSDKLGGMEMLSEDANAIQGYQLRTWVETWVEPVLTQLMLLEQHYETDENILPSPARRRTSGRTASRPRSRRDDDAGAGPHGPRRRRCNVSPKKQLENLLLHSRAIENVLKDGVLDKYNLNAEEFINEVFGKLGYRDGSRFFNFDTAIRRSRTCSSRCSSCSRRSTRSTRRSCSPRWWRRRRPRRRSVLADAFNKNVEGLFGAVESAEVIAAVPGVAPVADTIAKAAGYQPSTPPGQDPASMPAADGTRAGPQTKQPVINKHTASASTRSKPGACCPPGCRRTRTRCSRRCRASPTIRRGGVHQGIGSVAQLQK